MSNIITLYNRTTVPDSYIFIADPDLGMCTAILAHYIALGDIGKVVDIFSNSSIPLSVLPLDTPDDIKLAIELAI